MRKVLYVLILWLVTSCVASHDSKINESDIPDFVFFEESVYIPQQQKFDRLCRKMYDFVAETGLETEEDSAVVISVIDKLYSKADSISLACSEAWTLTELSMRLGEHFARPDSPLRSDLILELLLLREFGCMTYTSHDKMGIEWRLGMLRRNRPGSKTADMNLLAPDGEETNLHRLLGKKTLLLLYKDNCDKCRDLIADIESSRHIKSAVRRGELELVAVYTGEYLEPFMNGSVYRDFRKLPWKHFWDREEAVTYRNVYDQSLIPSYYLLSADGTVLLKAETEVTSKKKATFTAE